MNLGWVDISTEISKNQLEKLNENLKKIGFEILEDASQKQIENIKKLILEKVQNLDIDEDFLLSKYLSEQLHKEDYSSISKVFSQTENITLEQYFILQKIEKVKELLIYRELTLSQIADKLGYKTVQHLSQQFKKITGFSPSQFQELKEKKRLPIDLI
ncbi:MAG: helix-turn-helix transcriptional regulator [Cloacibacterium normanense]